MDIALPIALNGVLVMLFTQALKSLGSLLNVNIGGWGSVAVAAVVAGIMAAGNVALGSLDPALASVIVGFIGYLLAAMGTHSGLKVISGA
jgi:hypothetical protein